ncbi:MAG: hypothetical protein RLZZ471_814 [Actinomycetota bacterium]
MIKQISALAGVVISATAITLLPLGNLQVGTPPAANEFQVQAKALSLICPGAAMNSGGANGTSVGSFDRIGAVSISKNSTVGISTTNVGGATLLSASGATEQGSAALNAGQIQNAASARLNGLLGASCQAPGAQHWLLGGDTSTGRETLLLLSNPSSVPATVNLEVYAEGGRVQASGLSGIAVSAGETQVVPLSSLIPETRSFAVQVLSRGASVGAWLQQRTVRGLLYAGADFVSPVTEINKTLSIPGILVRGAKDAAALIAINDDYKDLIPALRVFNPSDKTATFTAQIFGANEKTFGTVVRDSIPAHSVKDFEITGLADGDYAAFISSDAAIAASVRLPRSDKTKKPNTDFTWLQSAQQLGDTQQITVPAAGISKLALTNSNNQPVNLTINGVAASIKAQGTLVVKVSAGAVTLKISDGKVGGNLVVDVSGAITNLALVDYRNSGSRVKVRVR